MTDDAMITLISRWKLRNGAPPELCAALDRLADDVAASEPDTLLYLVNLAARSPLDGGSEPLNPPAAPIAASEQDEVVFFEVYRNARAFAHHLQGSTFTEFRDRFLPYFYVDPDQPGSPRASTHFLTRRSGLVRPDRPEF